jgi:hypothetical protein
MVSEKDREQDESLSNLDGRVDKLEDRVSKLDSLDKKMDKIAANSEKMVQSQQQMVETQKQILASQREQRALQVFQSQAYSPTGFFAHELVVYLIGHFDKYQTTNFRRWLSVKGGRVVELNIAQYVNQKISMMQWYDTRLTSIDETHYHVTSKSAFPFQVNTGIPFVGSLTLTRVVMDISGDVDSETRETKNMTCKCCADEANKQIYQDFVDDVVGSVKPHKTTYKVLRPFGILTKKLYHLLRNQLSFSIPLVVLFLATLLMNWIPPAMIITDALHIGRVYAGLFGITVSGIFWGLINGVIYGTVIFLGLRYHVIGNLRKAFGKLRKLRKKKQETATTETVDCKTYKDNTKKA